MMVDYVQLTMVGQCVHVSMLGVVIWIIFTIVDAHPNFSGPATGSISIVIRWVIHVQHITIGFQQSFMFGGKKGFMTI